MNTLPIGAFCPRHLNLEETASTLLGTLNDYDPTVAERFQKRFNQLKPTHIANTQRLIAGLVLRLGKFCPPFTYVGHHPTDAALWGVWIDLGKLHRAEERGRLVQGDAYPTKSRATYVLVPQGHGVALFKRKGLQKLWETT